MLLANLVDDQLVRRRPSRRGARATPAVLVAVAVHLALFMMLAARAGPIGLMAEHDGRGQGIAVSLTRAPRTASPDGRLRSAASNPAPPHPMALARPAPEADGTPSLDPSDRAAPPIRDPSPSSVATDLPADSAGSSRLAVLPPPTPPTANPWSQASYLPQARTQPVLDLWPQVAPCWRGSAAQPVRLRLNLDAYGNLLSSDLLEDDQTDPAPSPQALAAAKAAVQACSPYVQSSQSALFVVFFPAAPLTER